MMRNYGGFAVYKVDQFVLRLRHASRMMRTTTGLRRDENSEQSRRSRQGFASFAKHGGAEVDRASHQSRSDDGLLRLRHPSRHGKTTRSEKRRRRRIGTTNSQHAHKEVLTNEENSISQNS